MSFTQCHTWLYDKKVKKHKKSEFSHTFVASLNFVASFLTLCGTECKLLCPELSF